MKTHFDFCTLTMLVRALIPVQSQWQDLHHVSQWVLSFEMDSQFKCCLKLQCSRPSVPPIIIPMDSLPTYMAVDQKGMKVVVSFPACSPVAHLKKLAIISVQRDQRDFDNMIRCMAAHWIDATSNKPLPEISVLHYYQQIRQLGSIKRLCKRILSHANLE
jgi:hypothetical protein